MMTSLVNEQLIIANAVQEAHEIKKKLANSVIDHLTTDDTPFSIFMAGSPGAGKTEIATNLTRYFPESFDENFVHINNDELRKQFADYNGLNSPLFQKAATILVEALHDRALKKNVSFILDSTLSSYSKAKSNIERSLKRSRFVVVIYVYQPPESAWKLVKAREVVEGRRVPEDVFVNQFLGSRVVVSQLIEEFHGQVLFILVKKDFSNDSEEIHFDTTDIESLLPKNYTREELFSISQT